MTDRWNIKPLRDTVSEIALSAGGLGLCAFGLSQIFNPIALGLAATTAITIVAARAWTPDRRTRPYEQRDSLSALSPERAAHLKARLGQFAEAASMKTVPSLLVDSDKKVRGGQANLDQYAVIIDTHIAEHKPRQAEFLAAHELKHLHTQDGHSTVAWAAGIIQPSIAGVSLLAGSCLNSFLHWMDRMDVPGVLQNGGLTLPHIAWAAAGVAAGLATVNRAHRISEYRADRFALDQTNDYEAAAAFLGSVPRKNPVARFFDDHPTPESRIRRLESVRKPAIPLLHAPAP